MNKLPQVLRNEIYEFARGDRHHWKSIFGQCISDMSQPINIRRSFDHPPHLPDYHEERYDENLEFFESLDLSSYPIDATERPWDCDRLLLLLTQPVSRFTEAETFENGFLRLSRRSDIFEGLIFDDIVPKSIYLSFPRTITPIEIRFVPVGNRLMIPWIPLVAFNFNEVLLRIDNKENVTCRSIHCHLDNPQRNFLTMVKSTATFQIGPRRHEMKFQGGFANIYNLNPKCPTKTPRSSSTKNPPSPSTPKTQLTTVPMPFIPTLTSTKRIQCPGLCHVMTKMISSKTSKLFSWSKDNT